MNRNENAKLYHKDIYIPKKFIEESIELQKSTNNFQFTKHLENRISAIDHSHYKVTSEKVWDFLIKMHENPIEPFEIETQIINDIETVTKYVVRGKCDEFEDIILVIRNNKVITAYINSNNDEHSTLDYSKYEK